jgi:hypothetical protein
MDAKEEVSQEERINKSIKLNKVAFSRSQGIFTEVYLGNLTHIVKRFNQKAN